MALTIGRHGGAAAQSGAQFDPPPFQTHSGTSRAAADSVGEVASTQRARVLDALRADGPQTDEELQHRLAMNPSTERPRRVELVRAGFVTDSGARRKTSTRRQAVVWEATKAVIPDPDYGRQESLVLRRLRAENEWLRARVAELEARVAGSEK